MIHLRFIVPAEKKDFKHTIWQPFGGEVKFCGGFHRKKMPWINTGKQRVTTDVDNLFGGDVFDELAEACELPCDMIATPWLQLMTVGTAPTRRHSTAAGVLVIVAPYFPHVDRLAQLLTQRHHVVHHACSTSRTSVVYLYRLRLS